MKLSLIRSVGLIAKAISACVKKQGYIFTRKQELINVMVVSSQVILENTFLNEKKKHPKVFKGCLISPPAVSPSQDFIKAEPADSMKTPVRQLVMTTCANLMYPFNEKL